MRDLAQELIFKFPAFGIAPAFLGPLPFEEKLLVT